MKLFDTPKSAHSSYTKKLIRNLQEIEDAYVSEYSSTTNGDKLLQLMNCPDKRQEVQALIWMKGHRDPSAVLKLTVVEDSDSQYQTQLFEQDIIEVFQRFGSLNGVQMSGKQAYIHFKDSVSAFFAERCLNNHFIPDLNIRLFVTWVQQSQQILVNKCIESYSLKLTCRYLIQIPNDRQFQVARKIIGNKGQNMKKIIEICSRLSSKNKQNQMLKLRLRGKGSGYKQGPNKAESEQPLHLCISSRFENVFERACSMVEQLLKSLYQQFATYCKKIKKPIVQFQIKKINACQSRPSFDSLETTIGEDDLNDAQIWHLVQARNNARKALNFGQADKIRDFLKGRGVVLIDEKGGRGTGAQVTTWKLVGRTN